MDSERITDRPTSVERRRFFELSGKIGLSAAAAVALAGVLGIPEAEAATVKEEKEREQSAKYKMVIATPYRLGLTRDFPVMQLNLKENIQNASHSKIYVKLVPAGALGVATKLVDKVQSGTIQAAQHSLSNFAPYAPAVDLVNIPYWCAENQKFVNLVTSDIWKKTVDVKVEKRGFKVLLYQCVNPRTASMRRGLRNTPFRTPKDLQGVKFRVPGSKILPKFYRMLGANPTPIAWGETAEALKEGVADALDPNVMGLFIFGFADIVSWVSFIQSVQDAGAYSCNLKWFQSLDDEAKEGVEYGSHITFLQDLAQVPASRAYAMDQMSRAGVKFYTPTDDELHQWIDKGGEQRKEWDSDKKELAGSIDAFEKLKEAANTRSKYYVTSARELG